MSFAEMQHTVGGPAVCTGVGVHGGSAVRLSVRPAPADTGLVFIRLDVLDRDNRILVSPEAVTRTTLNTEISNAAGVSVSTIEHLMAALCAAGVDNALIELDGPEVPIMDGSAAPFLKMLDLAGLRPQGAVRRYIEVLETIEVRQGDKRVALSPADGFELDVEIGFPSAAIGRQRFALAFDAPTFRRELAAARTFGFVEEVETLRARGLAQGGGLHNAVVVDGDRVLNPEGLRFADEFVRHKVLDAVGDLYVLGAPLLARMEGRYPGHAINNALARALAARPTAWRIRTFAPAYAEAV